LSFAQLKVQELQHANSNIFFHNSVSMILIVYHTLFQNALKTYHLKIEIYSHQKEEKQKNIVLCRGHVCYVVDNHRYLGDKKANLAFTD
jgi:hypothetical protein